MKRLSILFLFFVIHVMSFAQNFKGVVLDSDKKPIEAVSIYIKEIKQGLACNLSGNFQTTLLEGSYTCEFSCIGYEKVERKVKIQANTVTEIEVVLVSKIINLKDVEITQSKEDPANPIMRKAIEKAPYYRLLVKEYNSETYIKGSGKATHIPKMYDKLSGGELKIYRDKLFLQESFSDIHFTAPDKYEQTVNAFSSSMPNDFNPKETFGVFTSSLYQPMFMGFISPLNPKAFNYYNFRYYGCDDVNGQLVYKIKVVRKLQDPRLIEGFLYIADEEWNIRDVEMTGYPQIATINYRITYNQVVEKAYLPTSYQMDMKANIMGLKFEFNYLSSAKYLSVVLNDSLINGIEATTQKKKPKEKKSLEIKYVEKVKKEADSLATKRDSSYWAEIRSISLNEEEIKSYARKDTIQAKVDSIKQKKSHSKFSWTDPVFGGRIGKVDSSLVSLKYDGLAGACPEYNFVDGFWLGQGVELTYRKDSTHTIQFKPEAYWATARQQLNWKAALEINYAPMRLGKLSLSGGSESQDYMGNKGAGRLVNTIYTLDAGFSLAKYYQKDFANIWNQIDITNGLNLYTGFGLANRKVLENNTTFSFYKDFFGGKNRVESNVPNYPGNLNSEYNHLAKYVVWIQYTPEYYYRIHKGRKIYEKSRFPRFYGYYEQAVPLWSENNSTYSRIDLGVYQTLRLSIFDVLVYKLNAGKFFNKNEFNYIDYNHFNTANQFFTEKSFSNSYSLLDYYTYSTNKHWIEGSLVYNSQYLLIKRLPFMQRKIITESLYGKFLSTPEKTCYTEWGYALGLPGLGTINATVSFDKTKYNAFGVGISIPILRMVNSQR